jgi:hypothetical protein
MAVTPQSSRLYGSGEAKMNDKVLFAIEITRAQRQALRMVSAEIEKPMSAIVREGVAQVLRDTSPERAKIWEPELA